MDDDAAALRDHRGHELAIKPDGRHQVVIDLPGPFRVAERREAARRGGRAAEHVNDDIEPAQALAHRGCKRGRSPPASSGRR